MGIESDAIFEVPTVVNTADWTYGPPNVPVLISGTETIRVLLGTLDPEEADKPDLFIERRRNGWTIAIHPMNGDPSGIVYLFDDGRTFLVRCEPDSICVLDDGDSVTDELDGVRMRDGPAFRSLSPRRRSQRTADDILGGGRGPG